MFDCNRKWFAYHYFISMQNDCGITNRIWCLKMFILLSNLEVSQVFLFLPKPIFTHVFKLVGNFASLSTYKRDILHLLFWKFQAQSVLPNNVVPCISCWSPVYHAPSQAEAGFVTGCQELQNVHFCHQHADLWCSYSYSLGQYKYIYLTVFYNSNKMLLYACSQVRLT